MKPKNRSLSPLLLIVLGLAMGSHANAQLTWDNAGATDNWSNTDPNWLPGSVAWSDGQDAVFGSAPETVTPTTDNIVDDITFNGTWTVANGAAASINLTTDGNSDLTVGSGFTSTLAEVISGTNAMTKLGAGTLVLSGVNTYGGGTTVSDGVFSLSAANQAGTGGITLNGGTLRSTASGNLDTNAVTIGAGGGTIEQIQSAGTFRFQSANRLSGSGTLTITGNPAVNRMSSFANSGVVVLNNSNTYNGNIIVKDGGLLEYANAAGVAAGTTFTLNNNGTLSAGNLAVSQSVTVNSGGLLAFQNGNNGVFSGPITLNGNATVLMRDWYAATARNGAITGTMTGGGAITVAGGGVLTLRGFDAKASASDVTVSGSSLAVDSSAGTASASVARGNNLTLGNGNLTVTGVAGQNTNDTFNSLNLGAGFNTITLAPNAATNTQLTFGSIGNRAVGAYAVLSTGSTAFGAAPAANGSNLFFTTAPSGADFIGGGGALGSSNSSIIPWLRARGASDNNSNAALYTYDSTRGVVAIAGQVAFAGAGTTDNVLAAAGGTLAANKTVNSYVGSGNIVMAGNTLTVTSGAIINDVGLTIGSDTSTPGTLNFGTAEAQLTSRNNRTLTINSVITGSGGLTHVGTRVNGDPNLILAGANNYTGVTTFYGYGGNSNVRLTNSLALQNTTLNHVAGRGYTLTFGNGGTTGQTAYTLGGLSGNANINLNNNNTTVGAVALTVGGNNESTTYSGVLSSTVAGGSLTKTGSGTLTLTGANTYTGATLVSNGTLVINGSLASTAISVGTGASLAGSGSITGTITTSGSLRPGNSIGTMSVANDLTWNAGDAWVFELGSAASSLALAGTGGSVQDLLNITGGNDFNRGTGADGSFAFDFAGSGEAGFYKLVDWDGATGFTDAAFSATNLAAGLSGTFTVDSGTSALYVNVIPEPGAIVPGCLGLLTLLRRRRK